MLSIYFAEVFIPNFVVLLFRYEMVIHDTCFTYESGCITTDSYLNINLPHRPSKFLLGVGRNVGGDELNKNRTYLLEFFLILFTVEFERIVHDITVVEGGNS